MECKWFIDQLDETNLTRNSDKKVTSVMKKCKKAMFGQFAKCLEAAVVGAEPRDAEAPG